MRTLNIYMCEDEEMSAGINQIILKEYKKQRKIEINLVNLIAYKEQDIELMKKIDIAILDVELGENVENGIKLAKRMREINPQIVIIFITAFTKYAEEAAQLHLSGFLPKPVNAMAFFDTLDRAIVQVNGYKIMKLNKRTIKLCNEKITMHERDIKSIVKIENSHEVEVITTDGNIVVYGSIKSLEERLSNDFMKVNRSVIVNLAYVFKVEFNNVIMKGGESYQISTRSIKRVVKAFDNYNNEKFSW